MEHALPTDASTTTSRPLPGHFWLWVMCLTGVDYFSTLGYQPSIAFAAAGMLAPLATVVLAFVTLTCALPVYCRVAAESPHGQGSIAMLERLLSGWNGKLLVLVLLGFAATDFVITKTLSAADAVEHLLHNPWYPESPAWLHNQVLVTMVLLVLLDSVFLRGFREVITVAVGIVTAYLSLNVLILGSGLWFLYQHPDRLRDWWQAVQSGDWHLQHAPLPGHDWWAIVGVCLLLFPKLALGLSGFETGVAVMPLVRGWADDDPERPRGRIIHTRRLLATAALIMTVMLLGSSLVTATLIDPDELELGGKAANRALAWLAHGESRDAISPLFGPVFGTLYDVVTIAILWFAGASAMSGLLNLLPRYLPRYGMAPEWASSIVPLVLLLTAINLLVTWLFDADVAAQGAAYATGVMVLMSSASVAVAIDRWQVAGAGRPPARNLFVVLWRTPWRYVAVSAAFLYTTGAIIVEKPEGAIISGFFIAAVVVLSVISRVLRSTELRFVEFEHVSLPSRLLWDTLRHLEFPVLVPHRPGQHGLAEKEVQIRRTHRLGPEVPIVFVEATVGDASDFYQRPLMEIVQQDERFVIVVTQCASVAHVLATIALELSKTGRPPELHFGWSDESPLRTNLKFLLLGEGNVPWIVRQLIRNAEPDPERRPRVFIG